MDTPTGTVNEQPMLFICHTCLDEAYVTDLAAKLEARGIRCWYYERDNNGESIGLAVDKALEESLCLLFVMSENIPETSQYIQNELIEFVRTKRKVIPLRVSMPQSFWPKGSKSLIGAFPVVNDVKGQISDSVLSEIHRRLFLCGQSSSISAKRTPRLLSKTLTVIFVMFIILVIIILFSFRENKVPRSKIKSDDVLLQVEQLKVKSNDGFVQLLSQCQPEKLRQIAIEIASSCVADLDADSDDSRAFKAIGPILSAVLPTMSTEEIRKCFWGAFAKTVEDEVNDGKNIPDLRKLLQKELCSANKDKQRWAIMVLMFESICQDCCNLGIVLDEIDRLLASVDGSAIHVGSLKEVLGNVRNGNFECKSSLSSVFL